jgi:hypothetical protein
MASPYLRKSLSPRLGSFSLGPTANYGLVSADPVNIPKNICQPPQHWFR